MGDAAGLYRKEALDQLEVSSEGRVRPALSEPSRLARITIVAVIALAATGVVLGLTNHTDIAARGPAVLQGRRSLTAVIPGGFDPLLRRGQTVEFTGASAPETLEFSVTETSLRPSNVVVLRAEAKDPLDGAARTRDPRSFGYVSIDLGEVPVLAKFIPALERLLVRED